MLYRALIGYTDAAWDGNPLYHYCDRRRDDHRFPSTRCGAGGAVHYLQCFLDLVIVLSQWLDSGDICMRAKLEGVSILDFRTRCALLFKQEYWWAEFWTAAVLSVWAIFTLILDIPINKYSTFHLLISLAGATVWKAIALALGGLLFLALYYHRPGARFVACFLTQWFFLLIAINFLQNNHLVGSAAFYLVWLPIVWIAQVKNLRAFLTLKRGKTQNGRSLA